MDKIEITAELLNGLADKLDAAGLSDEEAALVGVVLERASRIEPEVEGFESIVFSGPWAASSVGQPEGGDGYYYLGELHLQQLKAADIGAGGKRLAGALGLYGPHMDY